MVLHDFEQKKQRRRKIYSISAIANVYIDAARFYAFAKINNNDTMREKA